MTMLRSRAALLALAATALPAPAQTETDGWTPLFDGRDLSGWVNVNTAPETWQVRDGLLVCSGEPRGVLRTERMYQNYVLELDWRHTEKGGNAGLFVHADALPQVGAPYPHSVEVQIKDGDHGCIFGIRGCRVRPLTDPPAERYGRAHPSAERARPAGQWNHYRLTSRDGTLELAVNGEVVTRATDATRRKGYICFEAEHSEVHFRDVRIRELPGAELPDEQVAQADRGFRSLFDGTTFRGWQVDEGLRAQWAIDDGVVGVRPQQPPRRRGQTEHLWTEDSYRDFTLIADWRLPGKPVRRPMNKFTDDGLLARDEDGRIVQREILHAGDSGIFVRGDRRAQVNIWSQPMGSGDINPYHKDRDLSAEIRRACLPETRADAPFGDWNRFEITVRKQRVTVVLNGDTVIDAARLPGLAAKGPIGLQNHREPIDFRNLYVKPLP